MALLIAGLAGASVLLGVPVLRHARHAERARHLSIALALGALLALLLLDLLPEAHAYGYSAGAFRAVFWLASGMLLLWLLDARIPGHETAEDGASAESSAHIGVMAAAAIVLHNVIEGMTVYSLAAHTSLTGAIFALGVAMHNIPMGMLLAATLRAYPRRTRWLLWILVASSTFFGGLGMVMLSCRYPAYDEGALVCMATGMILYLIIIELFPHVRRMEDWRHTLPAAVLGFALVCLSTLLA